MRLPAVVLLLATALCQIVALPREVRADDLTEYRLARSRYEAGLFADAAERFGQLLDADHPKYLQDASIRQQAKKDYAATLIALDRNAEADRTIEEILSEEPSYEPRIGDYPQIVIDRYITVRARLTPPTGPPPDEVAKLKARIAALNQKLAALKVLASRETVVETHSRLIAMIPFGVGQFQNGADGWGWFFGISEVLTIAAATVSGVIAQDFGSVSCQLPDPVENASIDCAELESSFLLARGINWTALGLTGALMLAGIIEAQVSFVPEVRTTRLRQTPVQLKPAAAITGQSVWLGLSGTF